MVVPLTLGLGARILLRPRKGTLHWLLAGLLLTLGAWVATIALAGMIRDDPWGAGTRLRLLLACPLIVLYLLTMALFSRVEIFESSRATCIAVAVPFALFALLIATNGVHRLVFIAPPAPGLPPSAWAGPGFWAFALWIYAYSLLGIGFIARGLFPGRPHGERWRSALLAAASFMPVLAHTATLFEWFPLDFAPTPVAVGLSALLLVVAIDRYGLLDTQPIVRRDVIEELHDGLVLTDADGLLIDLNRSGERILGNSRHELRGRSLADVLRELARPGEEGWLLRHMDMSGIEAKEIELETSDGRHLEIRSGALRAFSDRPAGRFLVLCDRTDHWRQQRMLQQHQRLESIGVLAAGVAHEVNNPLAFVRANLTHLAELLMSEAKRAGAERGRDIDDELSEVVAESLEGLDRIAQIVAGLLHLARPPVEERRPVCLAHVAEEALRFAALHRGPPLRVETSFAPDLPAVQASEGRLVQVVLNLLLNARQSLAGQKAARIRVETAREGERAVLRVRDNGPGVSPEIRERIFDPFFTTRRPGEGTGLGLAIAFDIVREHRGSLELETPGTGACFAVRLPLSPESPEGAPNLGAP